MKKSISVVIPNYNGKSLLEKNLPHVLKALASSAVEDFEIIVSDDASADDSLSFLQREYPSVLSVETAVNTGFSGNCNRGIAKASKELVLLLNNDVELCEGYFIPLFPYFERQDTFGVMGCIKSLDQSQWQDGAKYPAYGFASIKGSVNYSAEGQKEYYSFFLSGANALVDRKKLLEIGGFCELFNPYYWEDLELGLRAWRMGFALYYEHKALCLHPLSATIKKEPSEKVRLVTLRNKLLLHDLHLPPFRRLLFMLKMRLKAFVSGLKGDAVPRKALAQFAKMAAERQAEKEKLAHLLKSRGKNRSLAACVQVILNSLQGKVLKKF